jgi:hypothetical protein
MPSFSAFLGVWQWFSAFMRQTLSAFSIHTYVEARYIARLNPKLASLALSTALVAAKTAVNDRPRSPVPGARGASRQTASNAASAADYNR